MITGRPGIGKTTVLTQAIGLLRSAGIVVGGMTTGEVRSGGVRTGFEVVDLLSQRRGVLATTGKAVGPRLGRYFVSLEDLVDVGVSAISNSISDDRVQVIAIDEIGPMELLSDRFCEAVSMAFDSGKTVLATVHERASHPILDWVRRRSDVGTLVLDIVNRREAHLHVYGFVASRLRLQSDF